MRDRSRDFADCFVQDAARRQSARLVFCGVADDSRSSYLTGCAEGPRAIREAYDGRCYNSTSESGVDLAGTVADLGDLRPREGPENTDHHYREQAAALWRQGRIPFFAGGDHAVTVPLVEALAAQRPVHVVQLDAHPDLHPTFDGSAFSHACTGWRLLQLEGVESLSQIGVRALTRAQALEAEKEKDRLRIFLARDLEGAVPRLAHIPKDAAVYLTLDLDVFDPGCAPGVSHPVPGGLTARQVLDMMQSAEWNLVGMDVVELNPQRDLNQMTAVLAARLLHEGMAAAYLRHLDLD